MDDIPSYTCRECKGAGVLNYWSKPDGDLQAPYSGGVSQQQAKVERRNCKSCEGRGRIKVSTGDRIKIFQHGRFVGSCTYPATVRETPFVSFRRGDYTLKNGRFEVFYQANAMLGIGDICCLCGYIAPNGDTSQYEKHLEEVRKVVLDSLKKARPE